MLTPPGPSLMAVAVTPHPTRFAGLSLMTRSALIQTVRFITYESFHSRHLFISLAISLNLSLLMCALVALCRHTPCGRIRVAASSVLRENAAGARR